jgi:hypothetical protein
MGTIRVDSKTSFSIGAEVKSWLDNPAFTLSPEDFRTTPKREVLKVIVHTTIGAWPQMRGVDRRTDRAENVASYWRRNKTSAATPLIVDSDGSVVQCHLLQPVTAWHAGSASLNSVGVECVQLPDGTVFPEAQAPTVAAVIDGLVRLRHPRINLLTLGELNVRTDYPTTGVRPPRATAPEARGVYGHRDVDPRGRGRGDPGDLLMLAIAAELEKLSVRSGEVPGGGYTVRRV